MSYRICGNCQELVEVGTTCSCKLKRVDNSRTHVSRERKFQKLRKQIINRDNGHCQRCLIKYGIVEFNDLQAHHIKSWRDYPELAYEESNLVTVCRRCNLDLGNSNKLDFEYVIPNKLEYFL